MLVANYDYETDIRIHAEEAYAEGKLEGNKETALRMLKRGRLSVEEIAEDSGLTIEQVTELQKNLQS